MNNSSEAAIILPESEFLYIGKVAALFVPLYDVVIYGSRARGDHKKYSDIDVAVYGAPQPFDLDVTRFYEVLSHSQLKAQAKIVQISEFKDKDFRANVLEDGILVYEGLGEFRKIRASAGFEHTAKPRFAGKPFHS